MLKRLISVTLLITLLTACIPRVGNTELATLTADRQGDTLTANLTLARDSTQVLVIFTGEGFREELPQGNLPAGEYAFSVTNPNPMACLASGYVGWQYFLVFCQ